jgi:hypothetical protein
VTINGYPMYGVSELMSAAAAVAPEPIEVTAGLERVVSLRDARIEDADMSWVEVVDALEAIRVDAPAAHVAAVAAAGGVENHLTLVPDKPWDDPSRRGPQVDLRTVRIGPLDSLVADAAYFDAIDRAVLHGGALSGLRAYYER